MPQVRNNRNFGWHAGTVTAWDMILNNDFYIYGDLHFGDVSVDVFTITGYMLVSGSPAIGIDMSGTFSTVAINIDGTCNGTSASAINIDLDYDFATIGAEYPAAIYLDLTQTSKFTTGYGGFYGIASRVRAAYANVGTYGILGKAYVTATGATQLINDVYGLMGELLINGTDTQRFATTSSLAAIRGSVSNSSTGAWNGQVFALMLDFGPHENYGDTTALIYAYTHGDAHCDYGFVINNYSPNMTTGIWITETAGSTPAIATGIDIDANCTIAAIAAKVAATAGGITVDAGTINHAVDGSIISVDLDVEGAYSVNAFNTTIDFETTGMGAADVTTGFKADINELLVHSDGAGLYGTDVTLTGFDTGRCDLVGHLVTLDGSKTGGDTSAGFKAISTQTINHSGEDLYGVWIDFSGITHTDGNIYGQYLDMSFTNGSAAYGLYVAMGGGIGSDAGVSINGLADSGLIINAVCTTAINVSAVQTDETGLDVAAVFQHGSYSSALAYGAQGEHLIIKSTSITASTTGTTYVFGDVNRITTSAASLGYINVGYDYLSVGHNLVNGWATRGRVALTATCVVGEMAGLLGTLEVTGTTAITGHGTGGAVLAAAILDLDIATTATVAQEVTVLEVRPHISANIVGSSAGIRVNVNCSSANYLDYGIDIRSMSAQQTAALRILMTGASASLPAAIVIEGQTSSTSVVTSAIKIQGSATYFADFSVSTDAAPFTKTVTEKTGNIVGLLAVKDQDGSTAYINCYA